jgi:hypothetical protein
MAPPKSNDELTKEQQQIKLRPDELMDTDVEEEWKEGGEKGFRKQSGNAPITTSSKKTQTSAAAENDRSKGGRAPSDNEVRNQQRPTSDQPKKERAPSDNELREQGRPTNDQLQKEQSQTKLRPDELKDTDVEDEYQEKDGGAFRKNSGKARL